MYTKWKRFWANAFEFGVPGDSARKGPIEATSEYVRSVFILNRLAVTRASHGAFPYESSLPMINLSKLEKS